MSGQVSLYFRDGQVIVVPQGGGGGYSFDIEPVLVVAPEAAAVSEALDEALKASSQAQGYQPDDGKPPRSPALKKVGARSYKAFYKGASHCYLYEEGDGLVLLRFKPARDGRGFDLAGDAVEPINDRVDAGRIVLDFLRDAPTMT